LKVNDIILSTRGTVGFCAIIKKDVLPAQIDQDIARIFIQKDDIIPEFLLAYMNSNYGQDWIKRNQTGMVQQGLSLQRVRELPIPFLSIYFQLKVQETINSGYDALSQSQLFYKQAETLLLDELGLYSWQPTKANTEVKSFKNSFLQSSRLDAEYYQPKYDEIEEKVNQYGCFKLKEVFNILSNPSPSIYIDNGTKVIKTKNIRVPSVNIAQIEDHTNEEVLLVEQNDLLFASMGVGSLGRVSFIDEPINNYTVDGTIKVFRVKEEFKDSLKEISTLLFLTSSIGQALIYKYVIGSTGIISISKNDVENLKIPNVNKNVSKQLADLVIQSQNLKKRSQHLLQVAKEAVEIAIEQSEETAMKFIQTQTQQL
jgi:restriction endonuclease S subunit